MLQLCVCRDNELLESLESTEEVRVALACASSNFTPLSCSPNFERVPYLDIRTLTHERIVNYVLVRRHFTLKVNMNLSEDKFSRMLRDSMKVFKGSRCAEAKDQEKLVINRVIITWNMIDYIRYDPFYEIIFVYIH